jgi:hypothetical protein
METRVFIFYKLNPGVERDAFEQRARDVEAKLAGGAPAVASYALTRLEGVLDSAEPAPYDYVESMEVTSLADYQGIGSDPDVEAFLRDWEDDVASYAIVHGVVVSST